RPGCVRGTTRITMPPSSSAQTGTTSKRYATNPRESDRSFCLRTRNDDIASSGESWFECGSVRRTSASRQERLVIRNPDHVTIAVANPDAAIGFFDLLGF